MPKCLKCVYLNMLHFLCLNWLGRPLGGLLQEYNTEWLSRWHSKPYRELIDPVRFPESLISFDKTTWSVQKNIDLQMLNIDFPPLFVPEEIFVVQV